MDKFFQIGKEHEDTVAYIKVYQNMTWAKELGVGILEGRQIEVIGVPSTR